MIISYEAYLQGLAKTPNQFYRDNVQEFTTTRWENTTRLETLYEENFDLEFNDKYEVIEDKVGNQYSNIDKIMGDYCGFQYKDCQHEIKRGQYIKWNNSYYLVYQGTDRLDTVSKCKVIKCTNKIRWYDPDTHEIKEYPVVIGQELSSTNPLINNDGSTPNGRLVLMLQCNEFTNKIKINQRFVLSHKQAFVVDEYNPYALADYNLDRADVLKFYISWVANNNSDDLENNISNDTDIYNLNIYPNVINQVSGFTGKLNAVVSLNNQAVDIPVQYTTSNSSIVKIDKLGTYTLVGKRDGKATIRCSIVGNNDIYDTTEINIVDELLVDDKIVVDQEFNYVNQYDKVTFKANLYRDGVLTDDIVTCTASGVNNRFYKLIESINKNEFTLECEESSITPLILTFESGIVTKQVKVDLLRFM